MGLTGRRLRSLAAFFTSAGLLYAQFCPAQTLPPTTISPAVDQACSTLLAAPALQKVFADVKADDRRVLQEHRHPRTTGHCETHRKARAAMSSGAPSLPGIRLP
jgi:hypothetical protein